MNNKNLIKSLRNGKNPKAIKHLFKCYPSIRNFIIKNGGSENDAKDLFQESLLIFYKNILNPDFQLTSTAHTYLFSICKYLWKAELKKMNRSIPLEQYHISDLIQEQVINHEEEEKKVVKLDEILNSLGDVCKKILEEYYYNKTSMIDIAKKFGYKNVNSAKTQKYKCIERAKKMALSLQLIKT